MELNDQYGIPDLRHLLAGRTPFPPYPPPPQNFNTYDPHLLLNGGVGINNHVGFSDSPTNPPPPPPPPPPPTSLITGFELEGNGRWPRQETLTLLEIRSQLDSKFKEANQKGPLWEEVSRIMAEEHGYQRTGKKCREKFENLYKYYKKTKEGKAGRQDGKHYRFFRQLEALYGDISNPISVSQPPHHFVGCFQDQKASESLSISNSSSFDSSSSSEDGDDDDKKKKMVMNGDYHGARKGKKSWKSKIRDFVDSQMKKLMETQEAWLEKMMKTLEQKEHERMSREEEWRRQEEARGDRERKFWANERAWFEARDAAFMEALKKITEKELKTASSSEKLMGNDGSETLESTVNSTDKWPESEISSLIHLRTNLEAKFQQSGYSKEALWIEISAKMGCVGYDRGPRSCEEKWEDINKYIRRSNECTKKRKENSTTCPHFQYLEPTYNHGGGFYGHGINQQGHETIAPSPSNVNVGTPVSDSCFRFLMGTEGENLWENYGVRINRGDDN